MASRATKPPGSNSSLPKEGADSIQDRLSRIEGHVRGIKKMVTEERGYDEILTQIAGVKAAINQVALKLLEQNLDRCVEEAASPTKGGQALNSYKKSLSLLLR